MNLRLLITLLPCYLVTLLPVLATAELPNDNVIYRSNIRTVQLYREGFELSLPLLALRTSDRLKLSFDDLDSGNKRYKFTILHCESDWTTSADLNPSEYIDGYREENIDDYTYSYNTTVKYTHYSVIFPTRGMRPKISGNYLMIVYDEDPSEVVFTRRFMVTETTPVGITGKVSQAPTAEKRNGGQQIDFTISLNGFQVSNMRQDIKAVVQQNERWDNLLQNIKPRFIRGETLDYSFDENNVFSGSNEYRSFDIKSLLYQSEKIGRILYDTSYQVYLLPDKPRSLKNYTIEKDLNGRFYIKNDENAQNSDIEADYAWVHFSLPFPAMIGNGNLYIAGALTNWRLDDNSRMKYSFGEKGYYLDLLLKQGLYNYVITFVERGKSAGDDSLIEGSHWETENEYTVYAYYREPGGLYDRLVAAQNISSSQP
ncbi:MAG: DUF5103 domain-containing protein [bacterium]